MCREEWRGRGERSERGGEFAYEKGEGGVVLGEDGRMEVEKCAGVCGAKKTMSCSWKVLGIRHFFNSIFIYICQVLT